MSNISEQADAQAAADLKKTRRQRPANRPVLDRLPPHSTEAEQGVIGCVMIDPNECLDILANKFSKTGKAAFYDLRHQTIYEHMTAMRAAGDAIDLITLQQRLKDAQLLEQVGGIAYLSQLQDIVPSAANLEYYTDIVMEKFVLRRYVQVCSGVVGKIYDYEGEVDDLAAEVEQEILKIHESKSGDFVLPTAHDLVMKSLDELDAAMHSNGQPTGISTGLIDLDNKVDGLHKGELIVFAARPSVGKTALAMNIAKHVALELHKPVGVFSLEMTSTSLIKRLLANEAKVNIRKLIKDQILQQTDTPKLTVAADKISHSPLWIDDTPQLTIMQIRARARRMVKDHGCELFVIDYLQLVKSSRNNRNDNREQEVADVSAGLKAMAKELNVPVIVLAQLNREIEKDKNRKPRLSDLRESGSIEQDADTVGLLYRDGDSEETEQDGSFTVNCLMAKQREGERDVLVKLLFLPFYTRFENLSPISESDVPANNEPYPVPSYLPYAEN